MLIAYFAASFALHFVQLIIKKIRARILMQKVEKFWKSPRKISPNIAFGMQLYYNYCNLIMEAILC